MGVIIDYELVEGCHRRQRGQLFLGETIRAASQIFELGLDQGVQIQKANRDGEQNISGRGQRK